MRRLLLFSSAFLIAVIFSLEFLPHRTVWVLAGVFAGVSVTLKILKLKTLRWLCVCTLGFCVGLLWCVGYRALLIPDTAKMDGMKIPVTAQVLAAPEPTQYGFSVSVRVELDGRRCESILYLDEVPHELMPGDTVRCVTRIRSSAAVADDFADYYHGQGVWFSLSANTINEHIPAEKTPLWAVPARISMLLGQTIDEIFDDDVSGFLKALLTGSRSGLSDEVRSDLSVSGIYHTVAVSGMHVSVLLGMLMFFLKKNKYLLAAVGLPTIVFFVCMTGASASSVRAGCMMSLMLLSPLARRENDPFTSLAAAALLLIAANPWAICDVGLQLSFASVAGILMFASGLCRPIMGSKAFLKLADIPVIGWFAKAMVSAFCCSIANMVFALPVAAYHFGISSIVAPVVNALTLWAVSVCFTVGGVLVLLACIRMPLIIAPAWGLGWLVRYILKTAEVFAELPFAAVYTQDPYFLLWLAFFYAVVLFCLLSPVKQRIGVVLLSLGLTLGICALCSRADARLPEFRFTALDVGQGQCLIWQQDEQTVVIDCGGSSPRQAGEDAARYLESCGDTEIEALVLTHYDTDHAAGAVTLLERIAVQRVYLPQTTGDNPALMAQIVQKAQQLGCTVCMVTQTQLLEFDDAAVRIFAPTGDGDDNESGISVLASAGEYDILVTGDMSTDGEIELLRTEELPQTELLVAGHHGSKTSTSYALLGAVRPKTVIISVGEDNRYGHPSADTLGRIETVGAQVYRTDLCGTITIRG